MKQLWARMFLNTFLSVYGFVAGAAYTTVEQGKTHTVVVGTWAIPAADLVAIPVVGVLFLPFALLVVGTERP